jgi:glycosyltransferase involved in cell wall biosynthesis
VFQGEWWRRLRFDQLKMAVRWEMIWLINPYGSLPGENWRETRYSMLARTLAEHGQQVVWWSASFSHVSKKQRCSSWLDRAVSTDFTIRLVPTPGYRSHVGLARLWFEAVFAWRVARAGRRGPAPDLIIAGHATQAVGCAAVWLSRCHGVPLVLDIIDLWPEVFATVLPAWLRRISPWLLAPLKALRKQIVARAAAVTAVAQSYLDQLRGEIARSTETAVVYWGMDLDELLAQRSGAQSPQGNGAGLGKPSGEVWAVYAGTLGDNYDVSTLLKASLLLQRRSSSVRLFIAGDGPRKQEVLAFIRRHGMANVAYLGVVPAGDLMPLYRACDIGLSLYRPGSTVAMPIKFFDYLAAGLPVVNSLPGELADLIERENLGLRYTAGDSESLADALERLANDAALREAMSQSAARAARQFDRRAQYGVFAQIARRLRPDLAGTEGDLVGEDVG